MTTTKDLVTAVYQIPSEDLRRTFDQVASTITTGRDLLGFKEQCLLQIQSERMRLSAYSGVVLQTSEVIDIKGQSTSGDTNIKLIINGKELKNAIGNLTSKAEYVKLEVLSGKVRLSAKRNKVTMNLYPAEKYPQPPIEANTTSVSIKRADFLNCINTVKDHAATQDVRHYLNGVWLDFLGEKVNYVASNGHSLCLHQSSCETQPLAVDSNTPPPLTTSPNSIILHNESVNGIIGALGMVNDEDITLNFSHNYVYIKFQSGLSIRTGLIDGKFPDYSRVIPQTNNVTYLINKKEFQSLMKSSKVLTDDKKPVVKIALQKDGFGTTVISENGNVFNDFIEHSSIGNTPVYDEMGFNPLLLIKGVNATTDVENIEITMNDNTYQQATIIKGEGVDYPFSSIMPVRL